MADEFDLQRFVDAQNVRGAYYEALREVRSGQKTGHWMWFVFPQIEGLGRSGMAQRYAISGLDEARAYLAHPMLGARLREAARALLELPGHDPVAIFGGLDAMKLRSSLTLFARASAGDHVFREALERYFGGEEDRATLQRLAERQSA